VSVIIEQPGEKFAYFLGHALIVVRILRKIPQMEGEMQLKILRIPCPIHYTDQQNLTFLSHEHK